MELDLVGRRAALMASSDGIGKAIACALAREGVHVMMCGRDADKLAGAVEEAKAAAREGAQVAGERIDLGTPDGPAAARRGRRRPPTAASTSCSRTPAARPPGRCSAFDDEAWQQRVRVRAAVGRARRPRRAAAPRGLRAGAHRLDRLVLDQGHAQRPRVLERLPAGHPRARQDARRGARAEGHHGQPDRARQDRHRARALARRHARRAQRLDGAEVRAASERDIPLGRYGEPDELAEVAVFLCSKAGRYVSGTATLVDGGLVRAL